MYHLGNRGFEFEPALIEKIKQIGEMKHFKNSYVIMDYGKYIKLMPPVIKGTLKEYRKTSKR